MYNEFMKLCMNYEFNENRATEIIKNIDVSGEFTISPEMKGVVYSPMKFTPLSMAIFYTNYSMVKLLLAFGADPNVIYNGWECVLWDLQYNFGANSEENRTRLKIARLLLENGADPLIAPENEDLYHYVLACSQDDMDELADYRFEFLNLIEEYIDDPTN